MEFLFSPEFYYLYDIVFEVSLIFKIMYVFQWSKTEIPISLGKTFLCDIIQQFGRIRLREGWIPSILDFPEHLRKKTPKPRKIRRTFKQNKMLGRRSFSQIFHQPDCYLFPIVAYFNIQVQCIFSSENHLELGNIHTTDCLEKIPI